MNQSLSNKLEKWVGIISPIVTIILLIVLYDKLADKKMLGVIVGTLSPFIFSFLIAWILNPLVVKLSEKFKVKRWFAALIVVILLILVIVLITIWIIPQLTRQFTLLLDYLPNVMDEVSANLEKLTYKIPIDNKYAETIKTELDGMLSAIFSGGLDVVSTSINAVGGFITTLFIAFMIFMASIYILIDFDKFSEKLFSLVPKRFEEDYIFLGNRINSVVVGYLRGLILETIVVALLAYIAFVIAGIEGALVFGIIIGITNIIPYFGPYIGAIPVAIFALTDSIKLFIIVIIITIVVQQIDGIVVKPKVFGKTTDVHPSVSIISIILFGKIFGFIGVVFAIPIAGFTIIIVKFAYGKLLKKYPDFLK